MTKFGKQKSIISCKTTCFGVLVLLSMIISCGSPGHENDDHEEYVNSIRETANRILDNGDSLKARTFFDSAYQTIEKPGIGDIINRFSFRGDNYYRRTGDPYRAIESLDSIFLTLSTEQLKKKYSKELITALFTKGDLLFDLQKYNEAYANYFEGKVLADSTLDPCSIADYTYRLGMVTYKQRKYDEAARFFKQGFEDMAQCPEEFRRFARSQELLGNISLSYGEMGLLDSAIVYGKRTLAFIRLHEKQYSDRKDYLAMARGVLYGNLGDLYFKVGDSVNAKRLFISSIIINSKKGYENRDAQFTLLKLGELYNDTGQSFNVPGVTKQLRLSLDTLKNAIVEIGLNKLNWKYYDKIQKKDEAYLYLQKYITLKDSLDRSNQKLVRADLGREFQRLEQRKKYLTLIRENDLKKVWLFIAIIFSIMTVAILFLLWKNWKGSNKNVSVLTRLNKHITFQNKQLEEALEDLKQSSNDKDRILKVVAHDLRNPIGAIGNISSILLEEIEFSEEHLQLVELIKESSEQSIEMINDLLNASVTNRPSEMKLEWMDISDLTFKCADQLRFKAEEKGQRIKVIAKEGIRIKADREKLGRVVSNLIINAIKFSPLNAVIRVKLERKNESLEIAVEDNGIGIPVALQKSVFDMFGAAKRPGTSGEQPFGIGLPFSKQIVEAHGGKIWFDSDVDKGTIFYVRLPIEIGIPEEIGTSK